MSWYMLKKIKRVYRVGYPYKENGLIRFFLLMYGVYPIVYQEGIVLINEKGDKKVVWEKMEEKSK